MHLNETQFISRLIYSTQRNEKFLNKRKENLSTTLEVNSLHVEFQLNEI